MAAKGRIDLRLATQVLLLQLAIVTLTLVVGFGLFAWLNLRRLDLQVHTHALDIARVVASSPTVVNNIARYDAAPLTASPQLVDELATGPIQGVAGRVQQRTHVMFVVVTNTSGIRLAHPDRSELGRRVSTDPSTALAGQEEVVHQTGTGNRMPTGWRRPRRPRNRCGRSASTRRRPG